MRGFRLDPAQVARGFDRAAPRYRERAHFQQRVRAELLGRLELLRLSPQLILDLGSASVTPWQALRQRYPESRILAVDLSLRMLLADRQADAQLGEATHCVCADAAQLPLLAGSVDLAFSNLMLQWCVDPLHTLAEARRVLAPGACLLFSALGQGSLIELRESWREVDDAVHVHEFFEIRDLGDALTAAGLVEAVLDRDVWVEHFPDCGALMASLREVGASNRSLDRSRVGLGRARFQALADAYERRRQAQGLPLSYELVFGLAWRPLEEGSQDSAEQSFPADRLRAQLRGWKPR